LPGWLSETSDLGSGDDVTVAMLFESELLPSAHDIGKSE
jgi:hypothetical protein